MGSAALVPWACSSSDDASPIVNSGGQHDGGTAGADPGGSSGQAGQAGGDVGGAGGAGGGRGDACPPIPLSCAPGACPESADDFDLEAKCGPYNGVDRYASDCGGVVIRVWGDRGNGFDYYSSDYSFDAQGKLVGYAFVNDVEGECPNVSGTPCAPVGEGERLCGEGGAGGQAGAGGQGGASNQAGTGGQGGASGD